MDTNTNSNSNGNSNSNSNGSSNGNGNGNSNSNGSSNGNSNGTCMCNGKKDMYKSRSNEDKFINLFTREGSFHGLDYRSVNYKAPNKLFPPKPKQKEIIDQILEMYNIDTHPYARVLLCSKPGFGKSTIAIQLCYELLNLRWCKKVSLVTTWSPIDPNDSFIRMYNKIKPTLEAPLIIVLNEIDLTVKNILEGKINISDASPMPIEITSKKGWNDFFDAFDIEIYKYVIIFMTSNQHTSYFNLLDPSLLREGRIDIVKDCD